MGHVLAQVVPVQQGIHTLDTHWTHIGHTLDTQSNCIIYNYYDYNLMIVLTVH